ncbi:MAG: MBL fold metallo-hydrolase [Acidimicrobiales bacterium]
MPPIPLPQALAADLHLLRLAPDPSPDDDGLVLPADALVWRDGEPLLADTGGPRSSDAFWAQLEAVLDPADLRWIFLSHDDADHTGNLAELLDRCPAATVVTTQLLGRRLRAVLDVPLDRCRWLNDGERAVLGGRTVVALRPPAYDGPATRGLFDEATGTYWAADCFGMALPHQVADVSQLDLDVWERGTLAYHRLLAPWAVDLDRRRWHRAVDRLRALDARLVVGAHGAPIRRPDVARALDLLHELPEQGVAPAPGQAVLERLLGEVHGLPAAG